MMKNIQVIPIKPLLTAYLRSTLIKLKNKAKVLKLEITNNMDARHKARQEISTTINRI